MQFSTPKFAWFCWFYSLNEKCDFDWFLASNVAAKSDFFASTFRRKFLEFRPYFWSQKSAQIGKFIPWMNYLNSAIFWLLKYRGNSRKTRRNRFRSKFHFFEWYKMFIIRKGDCFSALFRCQDRKSMPTGNWQSQNYQNWPPNFWQEE